LRERELFYSSLERLLKSGVSLADGLETVSAHSTPRLHKVVERIRSQLMAGTTLSAAMRASPGVFPAVHLGLVEAGERSGKLDWVLGRLAALDAEARQRRAKLIGSLAYPVLILVLSCVLLPVPRVLEGTGAYVRAVLSQLGFLVAAAGLLLTCIALAIRFSEELLGPLPGSLERKLFPMRRCLFFRTLAVCFQTGVSVREALLLAEPMWGSRENRTLIRGMVEALDAGRALTPSLAAFLLPQHVVIVATGEKSGALDKAFTDVADALEQAAETRRKLLMTVLSVAVSLAVALYVASQVLQGFNNALDLEENGLEEINRELRGTGLRL
jgi:general secretion pathway protein F